MIKREFHLSVVLTEGFNVKDDEFDELTTILKIAKGRVPKGLPRKIDGLKSVGIDELQHV